MTDSTQPGACPARRQGSAGHATAACVAVADVDIQLEEGTVVGLIGPNGAGKTSMIDALTGYHRPPSGTVAFGGRGHHRPAPATAARGAGLARTFQSVELFDDLTVDENLLSPPSDVDRRLGAARPVRCRTAPPRPRPTSTGRISVCGLDDVADRSRRDLRSGSASSSASAGRSRRRPRLVLLDEPAAGLDTDESRRARRVGCATLPAEHGVTRLPHRPRHGARARASATTSWCSTSAG